MTDSVRNSPSSLAAWLHGIVHIPEGDLDNACGWYQRAERVFLGVDAAPAEIAACLIGNAESLADYHRHC